MGPKVGPKVGLKVGPKVGPMWDPWVPCGTRAPTGLKHYFKHESGNLLEMSKNQTSPDKI